jgi:hypothetical protein
MAEETKKQDETIPGGFIIVNNRVVNAEGAPVAGWHVVNGEAVKDKPTKEAKS